MPGERRSAQDLVAQAAQTAISEVETIKKSIRADYKSSAIYANDEFPRQLMEAAKLIKADIGLEVIEIDYGHWDTHGDQGGVDGTFGDQVKVLADGLAAFHQDLGDKVKDILVLTVSEFGRTAAENGTGGTDHGWANCMLALGCGLGKPNSPVLTRWPGLAREQLHEGRDLLHTTDFRDVFGEIVSHHLGNPLLKTVVLPNHDFKDVGR